MKYPLYAFFVLLIPAITLAQEKTGQKVDTSGVQFLFGVGIYNSSTKITGVDHLTGWNSNTSSYPELTFGANMFFDKDTKDLVFMPSISLTGTKGIFTTDGGTATPSTVNYNYKQMMLSYHPKQCVF